MSPLAAFTTVARRLALCCYRSEKRHFEFAFVFKEPAIVHAYSAKTKQCEFMSEVTTMSVQSLVKTMDLLVGNSKSCSCYTWQSPTICHVFAH